MPVAAVSRPDLVEQRLRRRQLSAEDVERSRRVLSSEREP